MVCRSSIRKTVKGQFWSNRHCRRKYCRVSVWKRKGLRSRSLLQTFRSELGHRWQSHQREVHPVSFSRVALRRRDWVVRGLQRKTNGSVQRRVQRRLLRERQEAELGEEARNHGQPEEVSSLRVERIRLCVDSRNGATPANSTISYDWFPFNNGKLII